VNFTITKANGAVVTARPKTGSNGTAVYTLKLKSTDPKGTYQVGAAATINGTPVSAATSFTVQSRLFRRFKSEAHSSTYLT
jgi:hypothetical protein